MSKTSWFSTMKHTTAIAKGQVRMRKTSITGDDRKEAPKKTRKLPDYGFQGLKRSARKLGIKQVVDLSATPFFLRGSGYAEGTLFPWTMCDFSLMDSIECGIVKLPRVPVADNIPGGEMPRSSVICGSTSVPTCRKRVGAKSKHLRPPGTCQRF